MATDRIGIRELRDTLTAVVRRVRAGDTIEVTHDGIPVAVLSPYRARPLDQLIADGRATRAGRFRVPLSLLEPPPGVVPSEVIVGDRARR